MRGSAAARPNLAFAGHTDVVPPGDLSALAVRSVLGRNRRRRALGPRRLRHEGRRRRRGRRRLALHRQGAVRRLDQLPHHRRRGRPGGQRHGQAPRLGARQGRAFRPLHPRRTDLASARSATRSSTAGAARSTDGSRSSGRQGHVAYPHIADNPIRALAPVLTALLSPPLDQGNADFEPSNLEVISRRRRQPGGQRHSGRSAARLQRPLQRSLDARIRSRRRSRGGSRRRTEADARR